MIAVHIILIFPESVCPTRIPVASRDEKGFELIFGLNIQMKAKKIAGSLVSQTAYALSASTDITENTRYHTVSMSVTDLVPGDSCYFTFTCLSFH